MAQVSTTQSVSYGDNNTNCYSINGSFNNTFYKSDEDSQITRWLSPLEPNIRHQGVRTERYGNVGGWVLETSEFQEWRGGEGGADKAVLFCSGNPGVGKTYMSSLVIDSLYDQAKKEDIAVACLYYDFLAQQEQTVTNVMGAILKQLTGRGDIPGYIREAFQESKRIGGRGLLLVEIVQMLRIAIASVPQVYICIDALDECLPGGLADLLESLKDIVRDSPATRIFLTGRPHVREDLQRCFPKTVAIPISPNTDDIRAYMRMRLDRDSEPEAMNDELRADIAKAMLEKISDIFLLVSLNMDAILGEVTVRQRRKKVAEVARGNGLSDAYTATLSRLKAQRGNKSVLGLKVLMWVSHSERPLGAVELCHALGVEMGSADPDPENVPALRTLLASCLGLVTVEASSSTIRLVHFTLQEHLSTDPTLFLSPHSTIAGVCLTYLNFKSVWDLPPTCRSPPSTMPLLDYASHFWGKHATREMTGNAKILALKLLDRFEEHISARLLLFSRNDDRIPGPYFFGNSVPTGFTGLHAVAFFGIVGIVAAVLEMKGWDVNASDSLGSTALVWAAAKAHEEVVQLLLERGDVNPNQADTKYGQTPLSWAAERGHEGVVKQLLEREDTDPDQPDTRYGQSPLSWAAKNGHQGVVKMLLERGDVNPNQADTIGGRTPLSLAADHGYEGVVRMLLERGDVNPNLTDAFGRTPLSWAAGKGRKGVVQMLLERGGVSPDRADTHFGQTPLSLAAKGGHEGVAKMLLDRQDVNPNQADITFGQTPLSWAAERGLDGVVNILLERGDVNPNQPNAAGRTPLLLAAASGHEGVVKVLLERGNVNPNQEDTIDNRTPLSWAAERGHKGVVKILLERGDVNPNQANTFSGWTPLLWAVERGHEGIVKMLLERGDINPNQADTKYGQTPLSLAAKRGREGVVKMLLAHGDINPNQEDTVDKRTPLLWAAGHGYEDIVKMLLERGDVNPNQADTTFGQTPLSWAAERGREGVVKILLERKDVHTSTPNYQNQNPLSLALSKGHDDIVRILQERDCTKPHRADHGSQMSLPPSIPHQDECIVETQSGGDDPNNGITDLNDQPILPSAEPNKRDEILDPEDSAPKSSDGDLSSTESSRPSEPLSMWSLKFWRLRRKTSTHPNTRSTLLFPADQYWVIASFVCLLAFLVYILYFSLPYVFWSDT